jgi:hypothetical protein
MKCLLTSLIYAVGVSIALAEGSKISLEDILLLTERGVSDETILILLETQEIGFVPDVEDIDKLLAAVVSEEVIRYILRQSATYPAPSYSYQTTTYADRYTSYYSGSSFFLGYSSFPHDWFRNHYSGVHYTSPHHGATHYLGYNDHAVLYRGGHVEVHTSRYGLGNDTSGISQRGGAGRIAEQSVDVIGQHTENKQGVRNRSGSPKHIVEKTVIQRSRHKPVYGGQRRMGHNTRSRTQSSGLSGGHGGGH